MAKKYINFRDKSFKIQKWEPRKKDLDISRKKAIESKALASIRDDEINTNNSYVKTKLMLGKINARFKDKPVTPIVKIVNLWLSPYSK